MSKLLHEDQDGVAPDGEEQMGAYSAAVDSGLYDKFTRMSGKYDNVRRYWEDDLTRTWIRPHLARLIERRMSEMKRLRVMDLGCGSGDGYELLDGVRRTDPSLTMQEVHLLSDDVLGYYKGLDLNAALVDQARTVHGANPKLHFAQGDFCEGLPVDEGEPPYDLYLATYGTLSHHNEDKTLVRLLAEIASHTQDYCLIVGDWIGRHSYEWQSLWTNDFDDLANMDYVISYIYGEQEREQRRDELQHIYLRLMTPEEVMSCVREASDRAGVEIRLHRFYDRSVFTGRHMDTREYNPHGQPIRHFTNSLHEPNRRTDLSELIIDYVPREGFSFLNSFFSEVQMAWNTLVRSCERMLEDFDPERGCMRAEPEVPDAYPEALKAMIERMAAVINGVGWVDVGLPRENIIEPQLGYGLRALVSSMQRGMGCAHGLVGIFEIDKT